MPAARALLLILALAATAPEARAAVRAARPAQEPEAAGPEPPEPPPPSPEELAAARRAAASERLAEVEDLLVEGLFARHPSLARRRGLEPRDLRPLALGVATRLAWRRAMQRAEGELESVDALVLDPLRHADRAWVERFLAAERARDALVPEERWNPGLYVREVEAVLSAVAEAAELDANARVAAVTRHLEGVRPTLESARADLGDPSPQAAAFALFDVAALETLLGGDLDRRLEAARPAPRAWEGYAEARDDARAAAEDFRAWTAAESRRDQAARTLGEVGWRALAARLTGISTGPDGALDLDQLKARLLRDVAALDAALGDARLPPAPAADALEPAGLEERAGETLRLGWDEARRLGLVEGDAPRFDVAVRPATGAPARPAALELGPPPRLVFLAPSPRWPRSVRARRTFELAADAQRAAALRHGVPGEGVWEVWSRSSERVAQRALWNRAQREGWGLFAAERAARAGDEALVREVTRARLFEAVRAYAALALHADGAEEAEVARLVRGLTRIDAESAALEARAALLDPLAGAGYLAYLGLARAEAELAERVGPERATWAVGRLVRLAPSTPIDALLARPPDLGPPPPALEDPGKGPVDNPGPPDEEDEKEQD